MLAGSPIALLPVLAAFTALAVVALFRRRRPRQPLPEVEVTPIASEAGAAVRVAITNRGTRAMHAPMLTLRPAPPVVPAGRVTRVVPPAADRTPLPVPRLAPGASEYIDLPCPLTPGEAYTRVLGLSTDDTEEAVYGLPIETLLAVDVEWRTNRFPWPRRRHHAVLVRGHWLTAPTDDNTPTDPM